MIVEVIRIPKAENFSEQVANRSVGTTDIIAAVSKALLGDIFVRISCLAWKFEQSLNRIDGFLLIAWYQWDECFH